MKKYCFFVFYILSQINNLSYSQDDRWIYITENYKYSYYVDEQSVKCDENGNIEAWIKVYCLSDCREKTKNDKYKTEEYSKIKYKYYLEEKKDEMLYIVIYYTDESNYVIDNITAEENSEAEIVPGSVGEIVYNYVFKHFPCK